MNILQMLNNPKIMQMLQFLSNSNNPREQLDAMFGNNPQYQQFKKEIEGKNDNEIVQYFSNKFNEQGINLNNIINIAKQSGFIK